MRLRIPKILYGVFVRYVDGKSGLYGASPSKREAERLHDEAMEFRDIEAAVTMPFFKGTYVGVARPVRREEPR